jgi:hypothetical protein
MTCSHTCAYHRETPPCPPEPPVGTWVKDRFGATHYRKADGWAAAPTGFYALGKWQPMWGARGPLVECGPWGAEPASA